MPVERLLVETVEPVNLDLQRKDIDVCVLLDSQAANVNRVRKE